MARFNEGNIIRHVPLLRLAELRDHARRVAEANAHVETVCSEAAGRLDLQGEEEAREFKQALCEWMSVQIFEQAEGIRQRRRRRAAA